MPGTGSTRVARHRQYDNLGPTRGSYTTCTEMSGRGSGTGTTKITTRRALPTTPADLQPAHTGSCEVGAGTVRPEIADQPPATSSTPAATVDSSVFVWRR